MGLGRGGGFAWSRDITARLPEHVESGAVFPPWALDPDLVRRHPVTPESPVCYLHQSDGDPTIDVYARSGVGLPPLCCETAGYPFQGSLRLHIKYPINRGDKGRRMSTLMEACLQVHLLLRPFCLLGTLLLCLCQVRLSVSAHDTHVVNTVSNILPEVTYQCVALLLHGQ